MKIEFSKTSTPLPEGTIRLTESVYLKETVLEDKSVKLDLFFPSKANGSIVYDFTMYPEARSGSVHTLTEELMRQIYTGEFVIEDEAKTDVMRSITIGLGEMANQDPGNKIYYNMLNGNVIVTDADQLDWDDLIKHGGDMVKTLNTTRHLIATLLKEKEVEIREPGENGEDDVIVTKAVEDIAREEIRKFHEANKLNIDYSMFTNATEREILLAQLIDIIEFKQELMAATLVVNAQRSVAAFYENQKANNQENPIPEETEES